jgi:chemotaxis protein CheD
MIRININISELKAIKENCILETQSLGSCLGIALFDPTTKTAALAHVMLPDSKKANVGTKPGKYADTAIFKMLKEMTKMGASKAMIVAKIVGGACMFSGSTISDFMNIGARNVETAKKLLSEQKIPVVAEDTGGKHGRTIEFNTNTGKVTVKSAMHPIKEI